MALAQISPYNPVSEPAQAGKAEPQNNQALTSGAVDTKASRKAQTDTVTISPQAGQLASQLYSPQEEAKETPTQKAIESAQGKK